MTELAKEKRAELRMRAKAKEDFGPSVMLSLLDALDAAERESAALKSSLDGLPERFSHVVFVTAGLPLEMASKALMAARRVLEEAEGRRT